MSPGVEAVAVLELDAKQAAWPAYSGPKASRGTTKRQPSRGWAARWPPSGTLVMVAAPAADGAQNEVIRASCIDSLLLSHRLSLGRVALGSGWIFPQRMRCCIVSWTRDYERYLCVGKHVRRGLSHLTVMRGMLVWRDSQTKRALLRSGTSKFTSGRKLPIGGYLE
jgi:hypothetical protein